MDWTFAFHPSEDSTNTQRTRTLASCSAAGHVITDPRLDALALRHANIDVHDRPKLHYHNNSNLNLPGHPIAFPLASCGLPDCRDGQDALCGHQWQRLRTWILQPTVENDSESGRRDATRRYDTCPRR